jgi:hypothetical protein
MYASPKHPEASGDVLVSLPEATKNASASLSRRTNVTRLHAHSQRASFAPQASNGPPRKLQDVLSHTGHYLVLGLGSVVIEIRQKACRPLLGPPLSENQAAGKHPEGYLG